MEEAVRWLLIVALLMLSALFSGLNLGLMGLDKNGLEIIMAGGDPDEKRYAAKIAPVRARGNQLLCTLLLGNVAVNSALSILLADLTDGTVGFIISTLLIVFLGEIVPQALCSRHPLAIGAHTLWIIKILMAVLWIATWPIARALDFFLGEEMGTIYNKNEFKKLVEMHVVSQEINKDEAKIMKGALELGTREVKEIMTPISDVYMVEVHRQLDVSFMSEIWKSGYSRIPVFDPNRDSNDNIVGMLFVKDLILIDPADCTPVQTIIEFYGRQNEYVFPDTKLREVLDVFKTGKCHMGIVHDVVDDGVRDPYYVNLGIITLEDVIERLIDEKIQDELDAADENPDDRTRKIGKFYEKMHMYSRRRIPNSVTPQEASAIFFHLTGTVDVFRPPPLGKRLVREQWLKRLIQDSVIITVDLPLERDDRTPLSLGPRAALPVKPDALQDRDVSDGGVFLYKRGQETEFFTLVLDGTIEIVAGSQGFVSEITRWSNLCADILSDVDVDLNTLLLDDSAQSSVQLQRQPSVECKYSDIVPDPANAAAVANLLRRTLLESSVSTATAATAASSAPVSANSLKLRPQKPYVPDFTARCVTRARVLRVHRFAYINALYGHFMPTPTHVVAPDNLPTPSSVLIARSKSSTPATASSNAARPLSRTLTRVDKAPHSTRDIDSLSDLSSSRARNGSTGSSGSQKLLSPSHVPSEISVDVARRSEQDYIPITITPVESKRNDQNISLVRVARVADQAVYAAEALDDEPETSHLP